MLVEHKRAILFWVGCIGTRLGFVYLAKTHPALLPYMAAVASVIALGFLTIYIGGFRKTGPETFGQEIWWNSLRPVHALLYTTFAYYAFEKNGDAASLVLGIDVALGAVAWIWNMKKM
jgi:hypothetical protein